MEMWQSLYFHEEFIQAAGAAGADLLHKGANSSVKTPALNFEWHTILKVPFGVISHPKGLERIFSREETHKI